MRPLRVGEQDLAALVDEAREQVEQQVGVARARRGRPTRARAATAPPRAARRPRPVDDRGLERRRRSAPRSARVIATASGDQSVASTRAPASAAAMLGSAEPAAELEHAHAAERAPRDRARERDAARPQLRPVREVLLVLERLLVEQRLAVARAQDRELAPAERDRLLDELDLDPADAHAQRIEAGSDPALPASPNGAARRRPGTSAADMAGV